MQSISTSVPPPKAGFGQTHFQRLSRRMSQSPFLIRLSHWEYWPFNVVYFPIFLYYLWLSLKARSFFFFSASNPGIETGGMLGESKISILNQIADEFKPTTLFVPLSASLDTVAARLQALGLGFPLIAKPDVGERGRGVQRIESLEALRRYLETSPLDFLIQEYVDAPLELGVFYHRHPREDRGIISSIVKKEFLTLRGNGMASVESLIMQNGRAILQWPALTERYGHLFHQIPAAGELVELGNIGNHCLGTKFLDATDLITPELTKVFDNISRSIPGFYFGRYDLRCWSLEDLYAGRSIRIMELNGAGAEPGHIYQPGFSLWAAYRVLFHHWKVMFDISRENHRRGVPYMTLHDAKQVWKRIQQHKKPNT